MFSSEPGHSERVIWYKQAGCVFEASVSILSVQSTVHWSDGRVVFLFRFEANQSLIEPGLEVCSVNQCVGAAPVPSTMSIQGAVKKVGAFCSMTCCGVSCVTVIMQYCNFQSVNTTSLVCVLHSLRRIGCLQDSDMLLQDRCWALKFKA
jgi:hypothetical protein